MVGIWQITADGIQLIAIKGEFQNKYPEFRGIFASNLEYLI